mgnify:CR=1 FL=1|jgi:hypothetical protein
MSPHPIIALVALKTITLLLGGLITYLSYKAYQRSGARPLWYLAVGFGIVTAGTLLAGVIDQAVGIWVGDGTIATPLGEFSQTAVTDTALVIETALTAVGFAVIVYSLYTE